ncbi:resolvase (plasmid) [Escherichia coli]|nr:resolvase [Escherichia coli]
MFIRTYLRASTEDQFADRAKEMLGQFVQDRGHKIASYYRENKTRPPGTGTLTDGQPPQ